MQEVSLDEARLRINGGKPLANRLNGKTPIGETPRVLLREDHRAAFPVVDGIPVLLGPEILAAKSTNFDLSNSHYAESYLETEFYDAEATAKAAEIRKSGLAQSRSEVILWLDRLHRLPASARSTFPEPREIWLHDRMDLGANWDCYHHIGSVAGKSVLQVGGSGGTVAGLLLAGAAEGWLLTPMIGEARLAAAIADAVGVRLRCVIGIGEELPFPDESFDAVFSGGCVHHMTTELAMPEIARVLAPGGKFSASEPWRAPCYALGTRVLGKREANAFCRPLTPERVAPLRSAFQVSRVSQHGTFSRYAMIALEKFGVRFPPSVAWHIGRIDDAISQLLGLRHLGSGVALLGYKPIDHGS